MRQPLSIKASHPNVCAKNATISTHMKHAEFLKALEVFDTMLHEGVQPDTATFLSLLKSPIIINGYLPYCRLVHDQIIRSDFDTNGMVGNALMQNLAA